MPVAIRNSRIADHVRLGVEIAKVDIKCGNFLGEATVRSRLIVGEDEGSAGVFHGDSGEFDRIGKFENHRNGEEKLGGAASFEDDRMWINEETRFGEDVRIEIGVREMRYDSAECRFKD